MNSKKRLLKSLRGEKAVSSSEKYNEVPDENFLAFYEGKSEKNSQPNIVLILVDDMGFSDIGCFGSEIDTPNIDKLADKGVSFTNAYNCARCCPSRASLLTGLYPHQTGIGYMNQDFFLPGYRGTLNKNCLTIAEVLKDVGYKTALLGKWHLNSEDKVKIKNNYLLYDEDSSTPKQRGFDYFYGTLMGAANYYNPKNLILNNKIILPEAENYYYTDSITDHAISTIDKFSKINNPFFLYISYTAPHWPLHAKVEDIDKYQGKYMVGWDETRKTRHERMKHIGILDSKWDISQRDELAPTWEDVRNKKWEDRRMAVYAAQIKSLDDNIGRVISKLNKLGLEDNTIIIFLSDNGGCAEFLEEDPGLFTSYFDLSTKDGKHIIFGNNPSLL